MIFLRAVPGGWIGTVPGFVAGVLGCRWVDRGRISVYPRPNANSLQHLVCTVTTFGVLDCSYLKFLDALRLFLAVSLHGIASHRATKA